MWTARPSREAGQIIDPANHRLRCGGADAIKRLGVFSSTKADAIMHHNRVEFRMALPTVVVKPQVFVESVETVEAVETVVVAPAPIAIVPPVPPPMPVQIKAVPPAPPPASPTNPADRLRHVLRQIKQIEAEGVYKLIPVDEDWRWRAADIGLED